MGKKKTRKKGGNPHPIKPDRTEPESKPIMIPLDNFRVITDYMLQLCPPHRNVFLSINEYKMTDINPTHKITEESPTHIIIFCIRLITSDLFHPLALVQVDKRLDQCDQLVIVWKTFIEDLSILRLNVIGSISPATPIFQNALKKLTENPDFEDYTGPITYSVGPYEEILHLYDCYHLMRELQHALYERVDMFFISRPIPEGEPESTSQETKLFNASWTDILITIAAAGINCIYTSTTSAGAQNDLSICDPYFETLYEMITSKGLRDTETRESTDILMHLLWAYAEFARNNVILTPDDLQDYYNKTMELQIIMASARFRWFESKFNLDTSKNKTSPKTESPIGLTSNPKEDTVSPTDNVSLRTENSNETSVKTESSIELSDDQMKHIMKTIDNSLESPEDPFDIFLQRLGYSDCDCVCYGDRDYPMKPNPAVDYTMCQSADEQLMVALRAKLAVAHDHDYFMKESPETLLPEAGTESRIANAVKEYFDGLREKHRKPLQDPQNGAGGDSKGTENSYKTAEEIKGSAKTAHDSHTSSIAKFEVQTEIRIPDFTYKQQSAIPPNIPHNQEQSDSRRIRKFQEEMQLLTTNKNESDAIPIKARRRRRSKKSVHSSPPSSDDCVLTSYEMPKMPGHNCDNCDGKQCTRIKGGLRVKTDLMPNLFTHTSEDSAGKNKIGDNSPIILANSPTQGSRDKTDHITSPANRPIKVADVSAIVPAIFRNILEYVVKKIEEQKRNHTDLNRISTSREAVSLSQTETSIQNADVMESAIRDPKSVGDLSKVGNKTRESSEYYDSIRETLERMTKSYHSSRVFQDYEGDSYSRTIDGLDLAITESDSFDNLSKSITNLAIQDLSNILVSSNNALDAEKSFEDTLQIKPKMSDSLDSLVELVSTFDDDVAISEIPSKYTIPKKMDSGTNTIPNIRNILKDITSDITKNDKQIKRLRNRLWSSNSASGLFTYSDLKDIFHVLKFSKVLHANSTNLNYPISENPATKLPPAELDALLENIPVADDWLNIDEKMQENVDINSHCITSSTPTESDSILLMTVALLQQDVSMIETEEDMSTHLPPATSNLDNLLIQIKQTDFGDTKSVIENIERYCNSLILSTTNNIPENVVGSNSPLSLCCSIPSTSSDVHVPHEVKVRKPLPYYTRFERSYSTSSSEEDVPMSLRESILINTSPSDNQAVFDMDNNATENNELTEIDYETYRASLLADLSDQKECNCDELFKNRDKYNALFNEIPEETETIRITNDWLCTFKGYLKLKDILERCKVKQIKSSMFCVDHITFYVALIKKVQNKIMSTVYKGHNYQFFDYKGAFDLLCLDKGVYILKNCENNE